MDELISRYVSRVSREMEANETDESAMVAEEEGVEADSTDEAAMTAGGDGGRGGCMQRCSGFHLSCHPEYILSCH